MTKINIKQQWLLCAALLCCLCIAQTANAVEPQKCNAPKPGDIVEAGETYWSGECLNGLANGKGYTFRISFSAKNHIPKPNLNDGVNSISVYVEIGNMVSGLRNGEWFYFNNFNFTKSDVNQYWNILAKFNYANGAVISMDSAPLTKVKGDTYIAGVEKTILELLKKFSFSDEKESKRLAGVKSLEIVKVVTPAGNCELARYNLNRTNSTVSLDNPNKVVIWTGVCEKNYSSVLVPVKNGTFITSLDGKKIDLIRRCPVTKNGGELCSLEDSESYYLGDQNEIWKNLTQSGGKDSRFINYGNTSFQPIVSNTYGIVQPNELPDWAKDLGKPLNQVRNPELVAVLQANNIVTAGNPTTTQASNQPAAETQNPNQIIVKAGKCQLYANTPPAGKVDWKGACVKGFANGDGITRYYNADKKLFAIGKDTYQNGQYQSTKDAYFINEGAIMQMAKDPNQPAQAVTKDDLPVWAMDIAKGASKQTNSAKPTVKGQAGASF